MCALCDCTTHHTGSERAHAKAKRLYKATNKQETGLRHMITMISRQEVRTFYLFSQIGMNSSILWALSHECAGIILKHCCNFQVASNFVMLHLRHS